MLSDSPLSAPSGAGSNQLSPSSNPRRNNRNRKQRPQSGAQSDSMVPESGLNPAASPRPKRVHNARQSPALGVTGSQQYPGSEYTATTKPRPVSVNGGPATGTPIKEQAYAGPTFQASPAASALPLPKFFSKSVPSGVGALSMQGRLAEEKSPEQQISSPEPDVVNPAAVPERETQQSPLDVFFKADRAEREKLRSNSNGTDKIAADQASRYRGQTAAIRSSTPGKNTLFSELDGEQSDPSNQTADAPVQRPPFGGRTSSSPNFSASSGGDIENRQVYTQSLKDLLFNPAAQSSTPPPYHSPQQHSTSRSPESVYFTPSPYERTRSGPTTPQNAPDQANQQSYHYGNRNLSPLFKAARVETPPRPSSLRQEVSYDAGSAMRVPIASNEPTQYSPQAHKNLPPQIPTQQSWSGAESRSSLPGYSAQQSFQQTPTKMPYPSPASPPPAGNVPDIPATSASPGPGGSRDVRSMENDLRRILKLNVLS